MRLINADELINIIAKQIRCDRHEIICGLLQAFIEQVEAMPTVDAVEVVRCRYCIMHNNCTTEEEDSFLMNRFMRQE